MSVEGHRHDQYARRDHTHAGGGVSAHASTHAAAGSDPVTLSQSQVTNLTTDLAGKAALAHSHVQGDVTNLTTDLAAKAPLASPALTGSPTAPTAAVDTNTTQVATTAFVLGQAAGSTSPMDGSAAVGTSTRYARQDHVHPSDTSRAALASPTFTGAPAAPTAAADTNTTQLATTAFVLGQAGSATPADLGTAAAGSSTRFARQDHVHKDPFTFSRCTSNSTAATTGTYVVPTGFSSTYALTSGRTYTFQIVGMYSCAATSYSIRFRLQYPALTAGTASLKTNTTLTAITTSGTVATLGASPTTFAPGNPGTAGGSFAFTIEGFLIPSANGNLIFDFTPNAAGSSDIKAGTYLVLTEV